MTSHGKPVAKIMLVGEDERIADSARPVLIRRLRSQRAVNIGRWTRDELYDDVPGTGEETANQ